MRKRVRSKRTITENKIRRSTLITVIGDAILIMALLLCLLIYNASNNASIYNQNVENITNIATGKSELMVAVLDNLSHEIDNSYRYCNNKNVTEILDYLSLISDEGDEYQLLKRDEELSGELYHVYSGYSTRKADGAYQPVEYWDTDLTYSLNQYAGQPAGEICYSQGFTNNTDALRYFAVFCGITAMEDGRLQKYYLVKPQKESRVLAQLQSYSQYGELTTAICYSDGKYMARDSAFRGDNFFDYLYSYNDLSLDARNAIKDSVQDDSDGVGILEYRDYKSRDCVFAYAVCGEAENWYVIASVPVSEFLSAQLLSIIPLIIIIFLASVLIFNIWRLLIIVQQLRQSAEREQIANTSKSLFLSRMSHEIRTPLNAIIGYNTIARGEMANAKDNADSEQAQMKVMDCLVKSDIASKNLLTIINDVLDMSAIESGKINVAHNRFDFKALIASLTTVFYSQAKAKKVGFEVLFDTLTEEWFVGDQMRTDQILTNILSNAIKFTPEGGTVTLKIQQPEADTNAAHIHFEISDTGIGMTSEYLKHIWAPFEQADSSISRRFGGTGLGLSITKNLVDLMGGEIKVESIPGGGTTFYIDLTFERVEQPQNSQVYDFSAVNALVVDDDSSTSDYIRLLFDRCGARCTAVTSGADALDAFSAAAEKGEPYSVCLVDWRMPDMDGIETIRRIRSIADDHVPLIVLTAYDFTELANKAAEVGVNQFISKPLFQSTLFDLLANISGAMPPISIKNNKIINFSGERILLAEDNAMNMEIAKMILESAGMVVDKAWNGAEAVSMFEASAAGTYVAILMDVHMPEMDGHEATRAIRASSHPQAPTIPIIAMTADAFAENVAEARESGMDDHIAKPIDVNKLLDTLKKHLKLR
ncbi:MAG: response regulator [Syntrophomonadaceae bacterium]|nr:response regulator [Syntrophomonadaceae bacterium]